ncbi:MAG TPA: cupin domain-containing protein [Candidatus Eremiobacteraceae bacterium]|nr:cupin domain-containing protein [Candidatus Eremiobacteraceae bacterium]
MAHKRNKKSAGSFWFEGDIKKFALGNGLYRKVVFTGPNSQLVVMNISKGEETEKERKDADAMVFIIKGKGKSVLGGRSHDVAKHDLVFVPAGRTHSLVNSGHRALKVIVVYSPPAFAEGEIQKTRNELSREKELALKRAWEQ